MCSHYFLGHPRRYVCGSPNEWSEVKVTVTQGWYATLSHPKMHPQTKFGIPTSNNIRDILWTQLFLKLGQRSSSRSQ